MDAFLPATLIVGALGLALGRETPERATLAAGLCALGAALASTFHAALPGGVGPALAIWASLAFTAAMALLPSPGRWILAVALQAGVVVGVEVGARPALVASLLAFAVVVPARAISRSGGAVALRVAASWLAVIGVLNAAIPLVTPTPGYVRDHLE